ncbi:Acetyltransferase (GNAT) family protein [Posidoniimonas polymericola]|uniref:Acetyltransferase (GNAT) family protein n=1 Tax=Posidoniimonas polymericola TaxID=2528002 RepID=A0A5C5YU24_9BACT|nr:GNAT family N-acetyltransferase [Posidoniimonas polymericola]TWT78468.1 Acetyltransferase (GNAT) family protein [Posidoniimonas polymericola]
MAQQWTPGLNGCEIRRLSDAEAPDADALTLRNPDPFGVYLQARQPNFFELCDAITASVCGRDDVLACLGAFVNGQLTGVASLGRVNRDIAIGAIPDWDALLEQHSEHDLNVCVTLWNDWTQAVIGAPHGSLCVQTLCVDAAYRRRGIATALVGALIDLLPTHGQSQLYMETMRTRSAVRFGRRLGFGVRRRTLSLSNRLRFGHWGTLLMVYSSGGRQRTTAAQQKTQGAGSP